MISEPGPTNFDERMLAAMRGSRFRGAPARGRPRSSRGACRRGRQAETSTGVRQPLENLGVGLPSGETLLVADCVTSLGGIELEPERWGFDYCYSCTRKCLGAPPGMSPVRLSERALERIRARRAQLLSPSTSRSLPATGSSGRPPTTTHPRSP